VFIATVTKFVGVFVRFSLRRFMDAKAKIKLFMIVLDAFTGNYTAHRFLLQPRIYTQGFTFEKILDENGLS
jgi:hypothetical protein